MTWNVDLKKDTFSEFCGNTLRIYLWGECNVSKHCIVCLNERMNPILELGLKNHFNPSRSRLIPLTVPRLYQAVAGTTVHCRIVFLILNFLSSQNLYNSNLYKFNCCCDQISTEATSTCLLLWHLRGKMRRWENEYRSGIWEERRSEQWHQMERKIRGGIIWEGRSKGWHLRGKTLRNCLFRHLSVHPCTHCL